MVRYQIKVLVLTELPSHEEALGDYTGESIRIRLKSRFDPGICVSHCQLVMVMLHELGHARLHGEGHDAPERHTPKFHEYVTQHQKAYYKMTSPVKTHTATFLPRKCNLLENPAFLGLLSDSGSQHWRDAMVAVENAYQTSIEQKLDEEYAQLRSYHRVGLQVYGRERWDNQHHGNNSRKIIGFGRGGLDRSDRWYRYDCEWEVTAWVCRQERPQTHARTPDMTLEFRTTRSCIPAGSVDSERFDQVQDGDVVISEFTEDEEQEINFAISGIMEREEMGEVI
ncbi:hypothetical protein ABW19_dt0200230 [Dactylella cylindrospora]|nr:hypothetical protein ABW19_dt0200230 [Dactylella cylindrospora]